MGSDVKNLKGFVSRGGETPFIDPFEAVIIGIDEPETDENWWAHCPRLHDETDADLDEYAEDLRRSGVVDEPVDFVRDGNRLVVIDGRRTVRAARIVRSEQTQAGLPVAERLTIRCIIRRGAPEELFRLNAQSHKHKALTPAQKAKLILTYYRRAGEDEKKTAHFFNCSTSHVKQSLAYFDLDESVKKAIKTTSDEGIAFSNAVKLASLPREEQKKLLAELLAEGTTKNSAVTAAVAARKRGETTAPKRDSGKKMKSRSFLTKWHDIVKQKEKERPDWENLVKILGYILGGPVPTELGEDFVESLREAGQRGLKKPKVSKAPKEKAAKKVKKNK